MAAEQSIINVSGQEEQDESVAPTGGCLESIGNQNLPPNGQTEWDTIYRPAAQFIVHLGTGGLLFLFREAIFGGKPQVNSTYIILMLIQLLVLASLRHSVTALFFSTNLTIKERCHEVQLSLIWLSISIILAVITSSVLMAKGYWASLA